MEYFPAPLEKLVEQFARLPGIGSKSAQRLAFHVLNLPMEQAQEFANAIVEAKQKRDPLSHLPQPHRRRPLPHLCQPQAGRKSAVRGGGSTGCHRHGARPESSMAATTSSMAFCPP